MKKKKVVKVKNEQIVKILEKLATVPAPTDAKGNLDVKAFNQLNEVVAIKDKLKELNITRKDLSARGFIAATMVLQFD